MKIEAVITCVDYADFLAETLPHNRNQFGRTVVVTAPEDRETRKICEYWNVQCILTDAFETRWGKFNKGKGINAGLKALSRSDWLVHMDADIALPPSSRGLIETANLDPTCVYGIDRHMVPNATAWREHMSQPRLQQEGWSDYADCGKFIHPHPHFPIGTRVAHPTGYVPIGFFQMWHASEKGPGYPEQHEVIGYHLESEASPMGVNWGGRKSKRFI